MTKNKLTKYGTTALVTFLVISALYFLMGEFLGNSLRVRFNLWFYKEEYNILAQKFLHHDRIKNIAFNAGYQIINNCSNHPDNSMNGGWVCIKDDLHPSHVQLKDVNAVLDYLMLPEEEYKYFVNFLEKYKINGIGKDDEKEFVELEDKLKGLRYYEKENSSYFVTDDEYLSVDKIDGHWFFYRRDWN